MIDQIIQVLLHGVISCLLRFFQPRIRRQLLRTQIDVALHASAVSQFSGRIAAPLSDQDLKQLLGFLAARDIFPLSLRLIPFEIFRVIIRVRIAGFQGRTRRMRRRLLRRHLTVASGQQAKQQNKDPQKRPHPHCTAMSRSSLFFQALNLLDQSICESLFQRSLL